MMVREVFLKEFSIPRNMNFVSGEIKDLVPFLCERISEKNMRGSSRMKLVSSLFESGNKAQTSKCSYMGNIRIFVV